MTVERRIPVSDRSGDYKPVSYGGHEPYLGKSLLACTSMGTALPTVNGISRPLLMKKLVAG